MFIVGFLIANKYGRKIFLSAFTLIQAKNFAAFLPLLISKRLLFQLHTHI